MSDITLRTVNINVTTSQASRTLLTVTFPCTLKNILYNLSASTQSSTANGTLFWAVVYAGDGNTANTISITDNNVFYAPEQDVLAFGVAKMQQNDIEESSVVQWQRQIKTSTSMRSGDTIRMIAISNNPTMTLTGAIRLLCT